MLTKSPKNYGSIFQFGYVIAYKSTGGDPIVEFNPSNRPDLWDDKWTVGDTYPMHTVGNLKVGKGDACRLVGFTVAEIKQAIKDKADSDTAPDNGKWRTPTKDENAIFTSIRSEWIENLDGVFNLNGYFFGPGASVGGTGGEFIPAAGCGVDYCGALEGYGSIGCYWSDMPKNINKYGCSLAFRSYFVNPDGTNRQSPGYYLSNYVYCNLLYIFFLLS